MLNKEIEQALNKQVNAELFASYLYYSMAAYFDSLNLGGFAHWMRVQALEEATHAHRIYAFIIERGGKVALAQIDGPGTAWDSPLAAFQAAYQHEIKVTKMINDLVDLAIEQRDHASNNFLQWYVKEQVEEEASADEVVQQLRLIQDAKGGGGIFMLDREMAQRVFTMPPDLAPKI
ncbi:MAG: ferritin [Candidatus Alcyoniella australis]|nr:ferritin [Candidatus Alcyoniella australis]